MIAHPDGGRQWWLVEFWPFHDDQDQVSGILGLVREIDQTPVAPDSEKQRLRVELMEIRDRAFSRVGHDHLIGKGSAHKRLLDQVSAAAHTLIPVLIIGESGTGKRLVARTIHQLSPRRQSSFIPLDCAALPPEVLERELFGQPVESGPVPSTLILPEGSTLLLVDILKTPRDLQARLAASHDSHLRLIATTTDDPQVAFRSETLRPDLYFSLTSLVIRLCPLRERLDEIPLLAQHFLERANYRGDRQRRGFSPEALKTLQIYDWPGNLREFARVIDDAHGQAASDLITENDLPAAIRGNLAGAFLPPPAPVSVESLDEILTKVERRLIEDALNRSRLNKSRAADLLGISRPRLYRRIKDLNIADPENGFKENALGMEGGQGENP